LPIVWNIKELPARAGKKQRFGALFRLCSYTRPRRSFKNNRLYTERASHCPRYVLAIKVGGVACSPRGVRCQKGNVIMRNDGQKSNRGFASMDQAKQREIASKGGQSVPPEKRSFSQDPNLAATAGRKGGESVPPEVRSFSQNRELAAEAGRKGGLARGSSMREGAMREATKSHAHEMPDVGHEEEPIPQPNKTGSVPTHKAGEPSHGAR
jgi:general stress protein YciG